MILYERSLLGLASVFIFSTMVAQTPTHIFKRAGAELVALVLLVPLAVILGAILLRVWGPSSGTSLVKDGQPLSVAVSPSPSVEANQSAGTGASSPSTPASQTVRLTIHTPGRSVSYDVAVAQEATVADVLLAAQQQGLQLETKDYGGSLGLFVEAIEGVANDTTKNMYWYLYVNGELSPLGASSAQAAPGDVIEWKYEAMKEVD